MCLVPMRMWQRTAPEMQASLKRNDLLGLYGRSAFHSSATSKNTRTKPCASPAVSLAISWRGMARSCICLRLTSTFNQLYALVLQLPRWRSMDEIGVCDSTGNYWKYSKIWFGAEEGGSDIAGTHRIWKVSLSCTLCTTSPFIIPYT